MEVCYRYDGTLEGFFTCVFQSYAHREPPADFRRTGDPFTLYEEREVTTDRAQAARVAARLKRISPAYLSWIGRAFLTCLPDKELALYTLIRRGLEEGDRVRQDLSDPVVARVMLALKKMWTEQDHLKGFVRFSDLGGVLVGEIQPKNRVLPLLGHHMANRFSGERIALYDRTHHEALFCENFRWTILPVEDFCPGEAGEADRDWQRLWRRYFKTIAIQGRTNPRCQATHLPQRYRGMMTEFQEEPYIDRPPLP